MDNYLITAIILCFYLRTVLTEPDLQQQNAAQDQLNPLNDHEHPGNSAKAQDKRTIFSSPNYGWAKHVGIKPSGQKYILGYSPVDLKYSPVIRPLNVRHPGYAYGKPKVHFHLKRPAVQLRPVKPVHPVVWRPAVPFKPVVPIQSPPHHHLVTKPSEVAHVDHVHLKPVHHVDHVHHIDHVHQVQVPHVDHVHNVPVHVDHVHPVPPQHVHIHPAPVQPVSVPQAIPLPLPQPLVPVLPPPQFIPPPLFEVTKPNLGVLPLGAAFPSPILRNIPHTHAAVPFPLQPAAVPLPQPVPIPKPALIPQPVVPQHAYPPGTVVEYHGNTNFLNQIPLPQIPVNAVQPIAPPHFHLQYPAQPPHILPQEQHDVQTPIIPQGHPHFIQQPIDQNRFQQQPPLDRPSHFQIADHVNNHNLFQQQLPVNIQPQFQTDQNNQQFIQQQLPQDSGARYHPADQPPVNVQTQFQSDQNNQQFIQQQLPHDSGPRFQPADQVSSQHFFQGTINPQQGNFEQLDNQDDGYIYQQPNTPFGQHSVQPGETDLQFPVHLPQHPGFVQNARQFSQNNFQEPSQLQSAFRPSIQLEPPYTK